jgi:hypothetical protein
MHSLKLSLFMNTHGTLLALLVLLISTSTITPIKMENKAMKLLTKLFAISAISLASLSANAELISTDWKTTGDSLATLDSETGIEWLDLTQTWNLSILTVQGLLDTNYEGWRLPTRNEVAVMMNTNGFSPVNGLFGSFFGYTYNAERSYGLVFNDTKATLGGNTVLMSGVRNGSYVYTNINQSDALSYRHGTKGVFLVNDGGVTLSSINDPSLNANNPNAPVADVPVTFALGGLAMMAFGLRRKQK